MTSEKRRALLQALFLLLLIYIFLLGVGFLETGFKTFGRDVAGKLMTMASNPFVALFVGILATSVMQSSSATTSMVVGLVGSGVLSVRLAVPLVMGANIGTTVTCLFVALGHMTKREEFGRAMSGASVHDFFKLIVVLILMPLEYFTGILEKTAGFLAGLVQSGSLEGGAPKMFRSPVKAVIQPVTHSVSELTSSLPVGLRATLLVIIGAALLFVALIFLTKTLRSLAMERMEVIIDRWLGKSGIVGILLGFVVTAVVQSSSITTSLMVPMVAAGMLTLEQLFPIIIGANVGTTVTALLASLATGSIGGLTIALVHVLFNVVGILMIYPIPAVRRIPLLLARRLGAVSRVSKWYAIGFVFGTFFLLPGLLLLVTSLL